MGTGLELNSKGMYHFHNVLSAHGALTELPITLDAGEHVSAVEIDTVNWRVHANHREILMFPFLGGEGGEGGRRR